MQFLTTFTTLLSISTAVLAAPCKRDIDKPLPASSLPAPENGLKLKYILLGIGTQNYTCADSSSNTKPVAVGAVATLYDMSSVAHAACSDEKIRFTPPMALSAHLMGKRYLDGYLKASGYDKVVGKHYFSAAGVPTFSLDGTGISPFPVLTAKKVANAAAPSDAFAGQPPNGAVDWLYLADNGNSVGMKAVYRVVTAGGKSSATCENQAGAQQIPYATEYWMYA